MRKGWIYSAVIMGLVLAGCADNSDHANIHAISQDDADKLNAQHASTDAVTDQPLTADSHYAAGQLAESQQAWGRAIEQYSEALSVDPKHSKSLFRIGVVFARTKDYPHAISTWKKYIKMTNGAAEGYSNLGFCYELAGVPDLAEGAYKKAIEKDPKNQPSRMNYGLMLIRHGRVEEGAAQLSAVIPASEVHYDIASIYQMQGKKEEAKAEYRKALDLDPAPLDARTRLASLD